jgi:ferric-dicitrate binding protein FerR (iron transport regulator)
MTRTLAALLCSTAFAFAARAGDGAVPSAASSRGAMTASFVEGMVTALPAGGGVPSPIAEGDPLHEGETVLTASGARLEISVANGSVIRLGESSRLLLGTAPESGHAFSARLFLGSLWTKVHKLLASETFHVETENGVAGVRGTEFVVEAGAAQDVVRVYEGAVQVDQVDGKRGWSHRIEPGHELAFHRERAPLGPRPFDPAGDQSSKLMSWVREHPPKGLGPHGGAEQERQQLERKHRRHERDERNERAHEHRGLRR